MERDCSEAGKLLIQNFRVLFLAGKAINTIWGRNLFLEEKERSL